jgi:choice-of-anchor C domain-containing protein
MALLMRRCLLFSESTPMKMTKLIQAATIAAMFASGAASASGNIILNGDFETVSNFHAYDYLVVGAGQGTIADWAVGGNSVDIINNSYNSISGNSIDMLGTPGPGSLSQSFSFAANTTYTLSFDLNRNPNSHGAGLDVFVNGGHHSYEGTSLTTNNSFNFTTGSVAGSQLLTFSSVGGDNYSGAVLDNVSLTAAVPEPETYAMLLAGLGMVGFMTRRKAKKAA